MMRWERSSQRAASSQAQVAPAGFAPTSKAASVEAPVPAETLSPEAPVGAYVIRNAYRWM